MKILFIVPNLKKKGPIEVLYNIVVNLQDQDISVLQLVEDKNSEENRKRFSKIEGLTIDTLLKGGLKKNILKVKSKLNKYLKEKKPDIIHSHCLLPDIFSAFLIKDYPRISTCHNNPYLDYSMKANFIVAKLMIMFQLKSFRKIDKTITISKYIDRIISREVDNTHLIYNGISEGLFEPVNDKEELLKIKKEYSLPLDKKIIISISSLIKRKNIELLLKTFVGLKLEDTILLVVGEGALKEDLIKTYGSNDNIYFLGHQQNISALLNISDLLVSLSHAEGLPLSIAESNAIGLPMVLSNIEPHTEQFEDHHLTDGRIQFYELEKDDVSILSNKIGNIISEHSGVKLNKLEKKFKSSYMAKKYIEIYRDVIHEN